MPHTQFGHPELGSCDTTKETEMKKALLASSALLLTAGVAAADVTISGAGRMGIVYVDPNLPNVDSQTRLDARLRFNFDASKETDAGVKFGGRIRMQWDDGQDAAGLSAAYVYAEADAFRVEVGNSNTAYDSAGLMYNSEVGTGYFGSSFGNPIGAYYSFSTGPLPGLDYMGVYAQYQTGGFVARISYVTPDQGDNTIIAGGAHEEDEVGISLDYATGPFAVSGAYVSNGFGIDNNDLFFLGAQYTINDTYNVGLLYNDNGEIGGIDAGKTTTLYGNGTFGATTVQGYLTNITGDNITDDDLAIGIGANYDLGGAALGGSIESGFDGSIGAKLGVGFSF